MADLPITKRDLSGLGQMLPDQRILCAHCQRDLWSRSERFGGYDYAANTTLPPRPGTPPDIYVIGEHEALCYRCWKKDLSSGPKAFRDIWRAAQHLGLPQAYRCDVTKTDRSVIRRLTPRFFIWGVREYGSHLYPLETPAHYLDRYYGERLAAATHPGEYWLVQKDGWEKALKGVRSLMEANGESHFRDITWFTYDATRTMPLSWPMEGNPIYAFSHLKWWLDEVVEFHLSQPMPVKLLAEKLV